MFGPKNPRFEIHFKDGKYQWYLKHTNRKTLAQGRPMGFTSFKGCKDALTLVRRMMDKDDPKSRWYAIEAEVFVHPSVDAKEEPNNAR